MEKLDVPKGIIYYTSNRIENPIKSVVRRFLLDANLPIASSSRQPVSFGDNIVVEGEYSYPTMVKQIIATLTLSYAKYVFFCEDDVLYHKSHFDFTPTRDDIFYYNDNTWRWLFGFDTAIRHDRMLSLSSLCVNREFALDHYLRRLKFIEKRGWTGLESKDPSWARKMGYEPGQKKIKRGGFSDDDFETFSSEFPLIDIRHKGTFSPPKTKLSDFKHPPKWFKEVPISEIDGWDLKELFDGS